MVKIAVVGRGEWHSEIRLNGENLWNTFKNFKKNYQNEVEKGLELI